MTEPSTTQIYARATDNIGEQIVHADFGALASWLRESLALEYRVAPHVAGDAVARKKAINAAKQSMRAIGPHVLDGTRAKANVREVTLLVWDVDGAPQDAWLAAIALLKAEGVAHIAYGSPGDDASASTRKVRLILPLSRPLVPTENDPLRAAVGKALGLVHDSVATDPSRIYFVGRLAQSPERAWWHGDGKPIDPADWVEEIAALAPTPAAPRAKKAGGRFAGIAPARRNTGSSTRRNTPKCPAGVEPAAHAVRICKLAPIAVEGEGGHGTLLALATDLVVGLGLEPDEAAEIAAEHYNVRCDPPWDLDGQIAADEWAHKFNEAAENKLEREPGYLLAPQRDDAGDAGHDPAVDHAISQLAAPALGVYQRSGHLVTVTRDASEAGDLIRPEGAPTIRELSTPRLREIIRSTAGPSMATLAGDVLARGEWSHIRPLDAIVSYPVLRRDGSLLVKSGYDATTRTLAEISVSVSVPSAPTLGHARAALATLVDLVADFPFAGGAHRSAWLAALLTPLARPAIDGPTPMLLLDASQRGSGKTLLADVIAMIVTGAEAPRRTAPETAEEWRKVVFALLRAGDPIALIDNVTRMLSSAALDAILTGTTYQDRVLGVSEEQRVAVRVMMIASANNCRVSTDLVRRTVLCRLEPDVEHPEARTGFAHADLLGHVRRERAKYLAAALTVLRAYAVAGRPAVKSARTMGSYTAWCRAVRDALVWAGADDPAGTQDALRESADVERDELRDLLTAWHPLLGDRAVTVRELLDATRPPAGAPLLDALRGLMPSGTDPAAHAVGNRLRTLRGQIVGGLVLREGSRARMGRARYQCMRVGPVGHGRT